MENTLSPSGVNEHLQSRHSPGTSHERNDFFSLSRPPTGSQGRGSLCPWRWWQPAPGGLRERERERELSGASAQIPELSRRQLPRECHGPLASPGTLGTGHAPCQDTHLGLVSVSWETSQRWLQVRGVRTEGQPARGASFPKPSTLGGK